MFSVPKPCLDTVELSDFTCAGRAWGLHVLIDNSYLKQVGKCVRPGHQSPSDNSPKKWGEVRGVGLMS